MPKEPQKFSDEEAEISRALNQLIAIAIDERDRVSRLSGHGPDVQAMRLFGRRRPRTYLALKAAQVIVNPLGEAAEAITAILGKRLHELGGLSIMRRVYELTTLQAGDNWDRAEQILDERWAGIGEGDPEEGCREDAFPWLAQF